MLAQENLGLLPTVQRYYFACLVPRHKSQIVGASRITTPFVVRSHHEKSVFVVATLLAGTITTINWIQSSITDRVSHRQTKWLVYKMHYLLGKACSKAHWGTLVVVTLSVTETITFEIRNIASFVRSSLMHHARTYRQLVGKWPHLSIVLDPLFTSLVCPIISVETFPLRAEIPTERQRTAPQNPELDETIELQFKVQFFLKETMREKWVALKKTLTDSSLLWGRTRLS